MIWTRSNSGIDRRSRNGFCRAAIACILIAGLTRCELARQEKLDASASAVPKGAPRAVNSHPRAGEDEHNLIAAFGGTYGDAKAEALLNNVAARLVAGSTEPTIGY